MASTVCGSIGSLIKTTLPELTLPAEEFNTVVCFADFNGVFAGVEKIKKILNNPDPATLASYTMTIMERLAKCSESNVRNYIFSRGLGHVGGLSNTVQKIEMLIRMAKLLRLRECCDFRNMAHGLFCPDSVADECPRSLQIDMAMLYAQTNEHTLAMVWLEKTKGSWDEYKQTAKILFNCRSFDEGLILLDSMKNQGESNENPDFVELLSQVLRNAVLVDDSHYFEALLSHQDNYEKALTIIHALCHIKKIEKAITFAAQYSLKDSSFYPMLSMVEHTRSDPEHFQLFMRTLFKVLDELQATTEEGDKSKHLLSLCMNPAFSVEEGLSFLDKSGLPPDSKVSKLWERKQCFTRKQKLTPKDQEDIMTLLFAIRKELKDMSRGDGSNYWEKVIDEYFQMGLYDEVLQLSAEWEDWQTHLPSEPLSYRYKLPTQFLSSSGIMKLGMGRIEEGLQDLKKAYESQLDQWKMTPQAANNFWYFTRDAANNVRYALQVGRLHDHLGTKFFGIWDKIGTKITYEDIEMIIRS